MKHTRASSLIGVREAIMAEPRAIGRRVASTVVYASRTQAMGVATGVVVVSPRHGFSCRIIRPSEMNSFLFVIRAQRASWFCSFCSVT